MGRLRGSDDMIPVMMRMWKPSGDAPSFPYEGGFLLALCIDKTAGNIYNFMDKDGANPSTYYDDVPSNIVWEYTSGVTDTQDYTSSTYDREYGFVDYATACIESYAYCNDILSDDCYHTWQLLDASDNNIFKFEVLGRGSGNYGVDARYTSGNNSPVNCTNTNSYPTCRLDFTFTASQVTASLFGASSDYINAFTASASVSSATKLKVFNGYATLTHAGIQTFKVYTWVCYWPGGKP